MVLLQTLVVSAFLTITSALPTTETKQTLQPFTVTQTPRQQIGNTTQHKTGLGSYVHSLQKFGGDEAHIAVVAAALAAVQASGSVVATPPGGYDVEYDCPVTIGSQTFKLDFDTGSSDLWVLGSQTKASASGHTLYSPGKTATIQSGETWKITYGDGSSASGTVYSDTVKVGNSVVTSQAVEMANTASSGFTSSSRTCDGLLGLGFDNINTARPRQVATFFTNAINQGLPQKLFTACLKKGGPGSYTFGAINSAQYSGSITYTNVDSSRGFWGFTPTSYIIGSGSSVTPNSSVLKGIADTGTTLLLMDNSVVTAYYKSVSGSTYNSQYGAYTFPCNANLPSFTLVINGYKAVVPGSYMNYARISNTMCFGGLQSDAGIGFNIYGDIFLKSQFVVFDRTQVIPRLGFAQQR